MPFIQYQAPSIVEILVLVSFFTFLAVSEWLSDKIVRAGILGPIVVGIIYGEPLGNILREEWQNTFLALGYVGLILIIFQGGLTARLDLVQRYLPLSLAAAATGVCFPLGLSYLLLYLGFEYGAVETFIIGAALSATSIGTTFSVISSATTSIDLSQTRVGTILISAAVIDDLSGLVMSSVIQQLGAVSSGSRSLGWLIGRPVLASILMTTVTPPATKYALAPLFQRHLQKRVARFGHVSNFIIMVLVLTAFASIASYAGTSVLFGAFLAGLFLTYLPGANNRNHITRNHRRTPDATHPSFAHSFQLYVRDVQTYILAPLFFASIGFAIPFLQLWTAEAIWRGLVFTLLMALGKAVVGMWILSWDALQIRQRRKSAAMAIPLAADDGATTRLRTQPAPKTSGWLANTPAALLLGSAMIARGEIGLLIVQIGFNSTNYVSEAGFVTAIWAILLNTVIGPIAVGILVRRRGAQIGEGSWGIDAGAGVMRETGGSAVNVNNTTVHEKIGRRWTW